MVVLLISKRSCRSRAVLCINKHWVHFNCEKFTELEIEQNEQNENEPYTCSQCKTKEVRKHLPIVLLANR
jgi:predicted RNA-binding Zn-ribbon protein involved in translation (DUF1610 family)